VYAWPFDIKAQASFFSEQVKRFIAAKLA